MRPALAALHALPPNVRGSLWMLLATGVFSAMEATIKALGQGYAGGEGLHAFQIAFFRCIFGGLAILPFLLRNGRRAFYTKRIGGHLGRSAAGYAAMALSFYALTHLPLADATALSFTRPLFMVPLAVLFLAEAVRWRRWTATAVGFIGVLVMARPGAGTFEIAAGAAIVSAFFVAVVGVTIKKLAETEQPGAIIFYFGVFSSILAVGPALWVWRPPSPIEFLALALLGAAGSVAQYCTIRAYRIAEATAVDPMDYARLLFAALFGFMLFAELPNRWTLLGAAIIIASAFYIARREAQLRRDADDLPALPDREQRETKKQDGERR
ncbi:MAG: DMT family transporter [Rhodospirillales bacterium]|nr:DMT family transporter [Rhodospirillales bacterium]